MTLEIFIGFFFHNVINGSSWAVSGRNIDRFSSFFSGFDNFIHDVFNRMVRRYDLRRTLN
tara:strand:+ start:129 stop:308 length:180 start_codon:yes stop_codon:yes gene_type:complete